MGTWYMNVWVYQGSILCLTCTASFLILVENDLELWKWWKHYWMVQMGDMFSCIAGSPAKVGDFLWWITSSNTFLFHLESVEWLDKTQHGYTVTISKQRWQHIWRVLRKQTKVGGIGIAYNKEKNKVSHHSLHHITNFPFHFSLQWSREEQKRKDHLDVGIRSCQLTRRSKRTPPVENYTTNGWMAMTGTTNTCTSWSQFILWKVGNRIFSICFWECAL